MRPQVSSRLMSNLDLSRAYVLDREDLQFSYGIESRSWALPSLTPMCWFALPYCRSEPPWPGRPKSTPAALPVSSLQHFSGVFLLVMVRLLVGARVYQEIALDARYGVERLVWTR